MAIYTIGFTQRSASDFFGTLRSAGIRRLVDVRLHNVSQLAGYSKRDDLAFFLRELCDATYVHEPSLAPEADMLDAYRSKRMTWQEYEDRFRELMAERQIETKLDRSAWESTPTVLLCSELTADRCHRRLVVEHLRDSGWTGLSAIHL